MLQHFVRILDAQAVSTPKPFHQVGYALIGFSPGPVTLQFQYILNGCHWPHPRLDHALHGAFMCFFTDITTRVRNHYYLNPSAIADNAGPTIHTLVHNPARTIRFFPLPVMAL